jgi:predicted amidophosphoribosyltransferase
MKKSPFAIASPSSLIPSLSSVIPSEAEGPQSAILLIDDVLTTGATSNAAIQTLTKKGYKNVKIYTLAQGSD